MSVTVPSKEQAACCVARRDELGRLPIGFCSPECERREALDRLRAEQRKINREALAQSWRWSG